LPTCTGPRFNPQQKREREEKEGEERGGRKKGGREGRKGGRDEGRKDLLYTFKVCMRAFRLFFVQK
jgi:hypothetical protein